MNKKLFLVLGMLVMLSIAVAACAPAPAEPETVTVIETVVVEKEGETIIETVIVEKEVEVEAAMPEEPLPDTLVICLGQEPDTMFRLGGSMAASLNVQEAIYDGGGQWHDENTFAYQAVIMEKLPSLADGDAVIAPVTVGEGDSIVDDTGSVAALETGLETPIMYRPPGCQSTECAVAYEGGDVEMDQLSVTFKLMEGLLWDDGTPLTTADSLYDYNLESDPDIPNARNYLLDRTATYEAPDDVTAVWTGLPGYLDSTYFLNFFTPAPEHIWGEYTAAELLEVVDAELLLPGWGPYKMQEWVKGDHITVVKNENYWRADEGLPKFETVIYRMVGENSNANIASLLAGDCDVVDQTSHLDDQSELLLELQASGQVNPTFVTGTVWEHADFNLRPWEDYLNSGLFSGWDTDGDGLGPFGDIRLRQAVAMCMDRQAVVDTVMFGQSSVLDVYIPAKHPLFNADANHYDFDVEAGSALLEEIGWIDSDGDGVREASGVTGVPDGTLLEFSYGTTTATQRQQATQIMGESMAECGMKVNLEYYPASEWFEDSPEAKMAGRQFDLAQFAWLSGVEPSCDLFIAEGIPGPTDQTNPFTGKPYVEWQIWNHTGYVSDEYELACAMALQSLPGQDNYIKGHIDSQQIFSVDLPIVPLYLRLKLAATRPDFCNFIMDPTNNSEFFNIEEFGYGPLCE